MMDLQAQKESLIERFRKINDVNLIEAIQKILDYAADKEDEIYSIPEAHQKLVMERFDKIKKAPIGIQKSGPQKQAGIYKTRLHVMPIFFKKLPSKIILLHQPKIIFRSL